MCRGEKIATRHHPSTIKLQLIFVYFPTTCIGTREEGLRFQNHESPVEPRWKEAKELLAFIIFEIFIYDHFKRIISQPTVEVSHVWGSRSSAKKKKMNDNP